MKYKNKILVFFAIFAMILAGIVFNSCGITPALTGTVTVTNIVSTTYDTTNIVNVIEIGMYTNIAIITNTVQITNDGYIIQGNIYITNSFNQATVQPTFKLSGYFDGDLVDYIADGTSSICAITTNSDYTNNAIVSSSAGKKTWEVVLYQQTNYSEIHVKVKAILTGIGTYSMGMNFYVSNIPYNTYDNSYAGLVTNVANIDIKGKVFVTGPDIVNHIYLYRVNESSATNSWDVSPYLIIIEWTNTISNSYWSETVPLDNGENDFFGWAVSTGGISNALEPFTITRSIIGVDGIKDDNWSTAPIVGTSTSSGYDEYQIGSLYITNDSTDIFFWVDAVNLPAPSAPHDGPRISIVIDTNNSTGGTTNDAWGGRFTYNFTNNYAPDIQIQFRIQEGGGQAVYFSSTTTNWNRVAENWGDNTIAQNNISMAVYYTNGFEISVPLSFFGLSSGDVIRALVVLSGEDNDGTTTMAWDVIPESPLNGYSTNANHFDVVEQTYCSPYIVN